MMRPVTDSEETGRHFLNWRQTRVFIAASSLALTAACGSAGSGERQEVDSSPVAAVANGEDTPRAAVTVTARPQPSHTPASARAKLAKPQSRHAVESQSHSLAFTRSAASPMTEQSKTPRTSHVPAATSMPSASSPAKHAANHAKDKADVTEPKFTPKEQKCFSGLMTIAHRGMGIGDTVFQGEHYPEDTIKSFKKGLSFDVCGFETDYYFTKQGQLISQHDPTMRRMTNSNEQTVDYRPGQKIYSPGATKIATNAEVLKETQSLSCFKLQEIKQDDMPEQGLEELVANAIKYAKDTRCIEFTSDRPRTLCRIKEIDPRFSTGLIYRGKHGRHPVRSVNPECVDVLNIDYRAADKGYVHEAAARGIEVAERNVDTLALKQKARLQGASQVITNKPWIIGARH